MAPESAEILALKTLEFLANSPDNLSAFLASTGINSYELRSRIGDPALLAAIVDFVLRNEEVLTEFCDAASVRPRDVHIAHQVLSDL